MSSTRNIDFDNVDKAFQELAGKPKALDDLRKAIEALRTHSGVPLTDHELKYLASNLAQQYKASANSANSKTVGDFAIKTSVDSE